MNTLLERFLDIKYCIEGKWFSERYDTEMKFSIFIQIVEVSQKININDYEIFYMGYKLGTKFYSNSMRSIIRIDISPCFFFNKINQSKIRAKSPRKIERTNQLIKIVISMVSNKQELFLKLDSKFKSLYSMNSNSITHKPSFNKTFNYSKETFILTVNNIKNAEMIFRFLNDISHDQTSVNHNMEVSIKIFDNKPKIQWDETKFFSNLEQITHDYNKKNKNAKSLPSARDVREASARSSKIVGIFTDNKDSPFKGPKIKNDMTYDDRILYLRSLEQPYLSISDPYLEIERIHLREELKEKKKWLVPLNFNSKSSNFIEPRKNLGESKIPIPISGEVRLKFKNLVDSKKFYHKIYKNNK